MKKKTRVGDSALECLRKERDRLLAEYRSIDARDWNGIHSSRWYVSAADDLGYVWLCVSREAAFARAAYWDADERVRALEEGRQPKTYVVQRRNRDGSYSAVFPDGSELPVLSVDEPWPGYAYRISEAHAC